MKHTNHETPIPDLRILPVTAIYAHEDHDEQRAKPLLETLAKADVLTNPPIVAPMDNENFVVLDGANRFYCFRQLGFDHLLVQVVDYDSEFVHLGVWQHILSEWEEEAFLQCLHPIDGIHLVDGWTSNAIAHVLMRHGQVYGVLATDETRASRNRVLREMVTTYRQRARLNRTASSEPQAIWPLYPNAFSLVLFEEYQPHEIIAGAREGAFLPSGVSRHIISGRALQLHYPMALLREDRDLASKNRLLENWIQEKFASRQVRFYAESTFYFNE